MATLAPPVDDPDLDLYADQRGRLKAASIIFIILPTMFVGLRLTSRKLSRAGYWVKKPKLGTCLIPDVTTFISGTIF